MDCSNIKSNIKIKEEYVEENEKLPLVDDTQVSHFTGEIHCEIVLKDYI